MLYFIVNPLMVENPPSLNLVAIEPTQRLWNYFETIVLCAYNVPEYSLKTLKILTIWGLHKLTGQIYRMSDIWPANVKYNRLPIMLLCSEASTRPTIISYEPFFCAKDVLILFANIISVLPRSSTAYFSCHK